VSPPRNTHGGRAAEVLRGGLAEGIITMPSAVLMHMTGWSSPICAAHQTKRKTAHGLVL
jgi:hypothetical protein